MVKKRPTGILSSLAAEIGAVVPDWMTVMFFGKPGAKKLFFRPNTKTVSREGGAILVPDALLKDAPQHIKPIKHRIADIYLPRTALLRRELSIPAENRVKLGRAIELDTLQRTPFKPGEIYSAFSSKPGSAGKSVVEQWIVRRADITRLKELLAKLGIRTRKVFIESTKTPALADFSAEIAPRARNWAVFNSLIVVAIVATALGSYLLPAWRDYQAVVEQRAVNEELSKRALLMRSVLEEQKAGSTDRTAFLELTTNRMAFADVLSMITTSLPDAVWTTDVILQDARVVLRGSTAGSAAELALALNENPLFGPARLTGPVAQTSDKRERFEITMDLRRAAR